MENHKNGVVRSTREPDISLTDEQVSRSVVISNIPANTERGKLYIHFQRTGQGGGEIEHLKLLEDGRAILTYEEATVAESVLQRKHEFGGVVLHLEPYKRVELKKQSMKVQQVQMFQGQPQRMPLYTNLTRPMRMPHHSQQSNQPMYHCPTGMQSMLQVANTGPPNPYTITQQQFVPQSMKVQQVQMFQGQPQRMPLYRNLTRPMRMPHHSQQSNQPMHHCPTGMQYMLQVANTGPPNPYTSLRPQQQFVLQEDHEDTRSSLETEQQAHKDTRSSLETEQQAHEDKRSSLETEQQAHEDTRSRLQAEQQAHEDTRIILDVEQFALDVIQIKFDVEQKAHEDTLMTLDVEQWAYEDTRSRLEAEQQAHKDTRSRLEAEQQAHEDTRSTLGEEQQAHEDTRSRLQAEQQTHEETRYYLSEAESAASSLCEALEDTRSTFAAEQQSHEDTRNSLEAEQQAHEDTRSRLEAGQQAHDERRNNLSEAELTITGLREDLEESRITEHEQQSDWILARNEIEMSERIIGVGGWGIVVEGRFRGSVVAVKQVHELILSPLNRRRFGREMNIASRCRHPCLLQFIGATNDNGSPLFVTELLDTNLRTVLEERALKPNEITTIALDVARALNYLHLNHPVPIIHRDISSANVLLWKHGESWRAKVSDYGAANIMQSSMTKCPGAEVYSAPEAQTSRQSPKVDVYSYGVLLCEMNIRELPDRSRRNQQVARVTSRSLRDLIRRCLKENHIDRPSMEEIILVLEGQ